MFKITRHKHKFTDYAVTRVINLPFKLEFRYRTRRCTICDKRKLVSFSKEHEDVNR